MHNYAEETVTPSQEIFDNIKGVAIEIWKGYDIDKDWKQKRIDKINLMMNRWGRVLEIYRIFNDEHKTLLIEKISEESADYILENY